MFFFHERWMNLPNYAENFIEKYSRVTEIWVIKHENGFWRVNRDDNAGLLRFLLENQGRFWDRALFISMMTDLASNFFIFINIYSSALKLQQFSYKRHLILDRLPSQKRRTIQQSKFFSSICNPFGYKWLQFYHHSFTSLEITAVLLSSTLARGSHKTSGDAGGDVYQPF